jgi:hypothetical protein
MGQGGEGRYQTTVAGLVVGAAKDHDRINVQGEEGRHRGCYGGLSLKVVDLDQTGCCGQIVCLT